jgi:hypothetical protein
VAAVVATTIARTTQVKKEPEAGIASKKRRRGRLPVASVSERPTPKIAPAVTDRPKTLHRTRRAERLRRMCRDRFEAP